MEMIVTVTGGTVPMIGTTVTLAGGIGKQTKSAGKQSEKLKGNGGKRSGRQKGKNAKPKRNSASRMMTKMMMKMTTRTKTTTRTITRKTTAARRMASTEVKGGTEC